MFSFEVKNKQSLMPIPISIQPLIVNKYKQYGITERTMDSGIKQKCLRINLHNFTIRKFRVELGKRKKKKTSFAHFFFA